ncbi:hypothetical protein Asp14428_04470 [Actinoplanes sp. NBRC 14428]|nr:hypothetical protein Asp14428_04470 [Actinoplanes sp. NBRC 14428]
MKNWSRRARLLAGALALSLVTVLAPASPALALNRVACNERGYLRIWFWSWTSDGFEYEDSICWANAGEDDRLEIRRATRLWSGENLGYVTTAQRGRIDFDKRNQEFDLHEGTVDFLKIN